MKQRAAKLSLFSFSKSNCREQNVLYQYSTYWYLIDPSYEFQSTEYWPLNTKLQTAFAMFIATAN